MMPTAKDVSLSNGSKAWEVTFRVILTVVGICAPVVTGMMFRLEDRVQSLETGQTEIKVRIEESSNNRARIDQIQRDMHALELLLERELRGRE